METAEPSNCVESTNEPTTTSVKEDFAKDNEIHEDVTGNAEETAADTTNNVRKSKGPKRNCDWYARGFCKHGLQCRNRHYRRFNMCPLYLLGFCPYGPDCMYMHPKNELPTVRRSDVKPNRNEMNKPNDQQ